MVKATYIMGELENKLLAKDSDTQALAEMSFETSNAKIKKLTKKKIEIIHNDAKTTKEEMKIENWVDKSDATTLKNHHIRSITNIQYEGKITEVMKDKITQ